jgi:hypothetical protein
MHLDDVPGAGLQVKAIHVLGEHRDLAVQRFEPGDRVMPGIGPGPRQLDSIWDR